MAAMQSLVERIFSAMTLLRSMTFRGSTIQGSTMTIQGEGRDPRRNFRDAEWRLETARRPKQRVRQGIAATRRHVAPARPLC
jgi:hypothetical protein